MITPLHAAESAAPSAASFIPLILIFGVFYFFMIRPQAKKQKEHAAMLAALTKGDEVFVAGGMLGTITKLDDKTQLVHVQIAKDVTIRVLKNTITQKLSPEAIEGDKVLQNESTKPSKK